MAERKKGKVNEKITQKKKAMELVGTETKERKWQTKLGRPQKFDPDLALSLMLTEIERYKNKQMPCYEIVPLSETKATMIGIAYPHLIDIAVACGVSRETLVNHCNAKNADGSLKNPQLFDALAIFKDIGEAMLIKGGLAGVYDSRIVQFIGNVNHGMIPKQQVEQSVEIKSMDKVYAELDAIYAKQEERLVKEKAEMEERKRMLDAMDEEE